MKASSLTAVCVVAVAAIGSSAVHAAYEDAVLASNPVGYWQLEETAVADGAADSVGSLDGVYERMADSRLGYPGPRPASFPGFASDNVAASFGGYDDYISVADDPALDIIGQLTLEAWINGRVWENPDSQVDGVVARFRSDSNRSYLLAVTSAGQLMMIVSSDGTSDAGKVKTVVTTDVDPVAGGSQALANDTWYHVAGVFDPSTSMKIYVNGQEVLEDTTSIPTSIYAGDAPLYIGNHYSTAAGSNRYFDGLIDEVAIYDRALSAGEIAGHYSASVPEPASVVLAFLGVACLSMRRRPVSE